MASTTGMIPVLTSIASISTTETHEYPVQAMTFWVIVGAAVLITAIIIKERFK